MYVDIKVWVFVNWNSFLFGQWSHRHSQLKYNDFFSPHISGLDGEKKLFIHNSKANQKENFFFTPKYNTYPVVENQTEQQLFSIKLDWKGSVDIRWS